MSDRRRDARVDRRCGFCGRPRYEVRKLVAGPSVFICDRCIAVCRQLLADDRSERMSGDRRPPRPRDLRLRLDDYIVGQDRAKRMLSVAVYNHLKRVSLRGQSSDVELQKGNILLLGPPGTGKTHLARTLARILDVPFALTDATPLTQAGYVGEDVESVVGRLFRAADNNAERAARGIIYLDEVDKIAKRTGHDRDVSGEGVQQGLLKILEGKRVAVRMGGDRTGLGAEVVEIDTSDVLFIAGGAFEGITKRIEERRRASSGFRPGGMEAANPYAGLVHVLPQDLHKYGMLPEFVGRFPILVSLEPLDEAMLVEILTRPKDALVRQYQRLFAMEGARLDFTPGALRMIGRAALARGTGARGLRAVIEDLLLETMFDLPSLGGGTYVVDEAAVGAGGPGETSGRTAA
jgi:ATP-dependent Clp protease ATP-binding subunit ClpX